MQLNSSQLISVIDNEHEFLIHFLEGQKMVSDLIIPYSLNAKGLQFFRDLVLSFMPIISFLKPKEGFGIYIDSEDPFFRFKIESNSIGNFRTLLMPNNFESFPLKLNGVCRIVKLLEGTNSYTSLIEIKNQNIDEICNVILNKSYQIDASVFLAQNSDQSILIMKLPPLSGKKQSPLSLKEYFLLKQKDFNQIFDKALNTTDAIKNEFTSRNFTYIANKEINFVCPCSKERMIQNILSLRNLKHEEIFENNQNSITITCDYCLKKYEIFRSEVINSL